MSFVQPWWWLLAPPLLAVLAWLHARRRRTLVVASLQGWEAVGRWQEGAARRPLPALSWALLLQVLAVMLVVGTLAEPRWGAAATSAGHELVVVIGTPDVDAAWQALRDHLETGPTPASLTLLDARGHARPLAARLQPARLAEHFASLTVADQAPPDWASVARLALAMPASVTGRQWLVLAAEEELASADEALRATLGEADPTMRLLGAGEGRPAAQLRGLAVAVTATGQELQAGVRVHAGGERSWRLEVRQQDRLLAEQAWTSTEPGDLRLVLPLPPFDAVTTVEILLVDALTEAVTASSHRTAGRVAPAPRVLLVGSPWPRLEATLEATGATVESVAAFPAETGAYDLVISLGVPAARQVETHVVWWGMLPPDIGTGDAALLPGPWDVLVMEQDPLLPLGMLHGFRAEAVLDHPVLPGAEVLAWAEARPAVQARVVEGLAELLISFPLDELAWSADDTPYVLLRRLLEWIEPMPACQVGVPCALAQRAGSIVMEPDGQATSAGAAWTRGASAMGWTSWFLPRLPGWHVLGTTAGQARFWVDAAPWPLVEGPLQPAVGTPGGIDAPPPTTWLSRLPLRALAPLALGLSLLAAWWPGLVQRWRAMRPGVRLLSLGLHLAFVAAALAAWTGLAWPRGPVTPVLVQVAPTEDAAPGGRADDRWRVDAGSGGGAAQIPSVWHAADLPSALAWANALLVDEPLGRQRWSLRGAERSLALGQALQTAAGRAELTVTPLPRFAEGEGVMPTTALVLGTTGAGGTSRIVVPVEAKRDLAVRALLWQDDELLAEIQTDLPAGRSMLSFDAPDTAVLATRYRLDLVGGEDDDTVLASVTAVVQAQAASRVAVVADDVAWALLFSQLLQVHGLEAELMMAQTAPRTVAGWAAYDAVILFDLPAIALVSAQMDALKAWVAEHGGGLLILGGEHSFGAGGYHLTVLDELSPLASEIPMDRPDVAIVFVLDRSGSMLQGVGPSNRLEIAREATWEAVRLLDPRSEVGIVVFDSNATVIHPLQPIGDLASLREALDRLTAGGGTNLQPALEQAYQILLPAADVQRHMVVMTDGLTQSGDFPPVMAALVEAGITASTLAIGQGAAYPRLEQIAQETGGIFHETVDFQLLPSIMAQEVLMLTTEPVQRGPSWASWSADGAAFTQDLNLDWPALQGFVRTTPKPAATIHATIGDGDALLASWRYGSGRVMAWASQGVGPWTMAWLSLTDFPRLWAQLVRWAAALGPPAGLDLELRQHGGELHIEISTNGVDGRPEAGWDLEATVVYLDGQGLPGDAILLREVEPGLHRGSWPAGTPGAYRVDVIGGADARSMRSATAEVVVPTKVDQTSSPDLMASLVLAVGAELTAEQAMVGGGWGWSWQPVVAWRPYLLLASLLWLGCLVTRSRSPVVPHLRSE